MLLFLLLLPNWYHPGQEAGRKHPAQVKGQEEAMKVKELTREIEEFRAALVAHRDLYARSVDIEFADYPVENEKKLRAQSEQLSRMLGRLRPYLQRFRVPRLARQPMTGQTVDILDVAVGMGHDVQTKGEVLDHAIDSVNQVIGNLQRFGPDDEIPDDPKSPVRSGASPDKRRLLSDLKSLLDTRSEVEDHNPWSDRGQQWLARATSLLRQVDPNLAAQFGGRAQTIQVRLSVYTAGPIWNQMLLMIRKAIADLELEISAAATDVDAVTGLLPRAALDADIEPILAEHQRRRLPLALFVIDVDRFKSVNDEHGHDVGDAVLKGVAGRIQQAVEGKGRAYRYGGEEIVVIFPNMTLEEALPVAERIRSSVEAGRIEPLTRAITVSVGLASFPRHGQDPQTLFRAADQAVLSAKERGRNRVEVAE